MQLRNPLAVVTPTVDGQVLEVLARANAEFTVPEIHALAGSRSQDGIRKACVRLANQGVVTERRAGNAWMYSLNREHLAANAIIALANLRTTLIASIRDVIEAWAIQPVYAAIFGSAARGDHRADSDIDLFVVRPNDANETEWDLQVASLARSVTAWTGSDTRPLEYAEADIAKSATTEPVLAAIAAEGITVAGSTGWLTGALRRARSSRTADTGRK